MEDLIQYLVKAKEQEMISELSLQGYDLQRDGSHGFDLLAVKGSERIAIVIKAASDLAGAREELRLLHEKAEQQGCQFRLVIVRPPHHVAVDIEGLEDILCEHLMNNLPSELDELSSNTIIDEVTDVEIDEIAASAEGLHITGSASVGVELEYAGGEERDGLTTYDSFPFTFDLDLNPDLTIREVNSINVETSRFYK